MAIQWYKKLDLAGSFDIEPSLITIFQKRASLTLFFSVQSKPERQISEAELLRGCQSIDSEARRPSLPALLAQSGFEASQKDFQINRDLFTGSYPDESSTIEAFIGP